MKKIRENGKQIKESFPVNSWRIGNARHFKTNKIVKMALVRIPDGAFQFKKPCGLSRMTGPTSHGHAIMQKQGKAMCS